MSRHTASTTPESRAASAAFVHPGQRFAVAHTSEVREVPNYAIGRAGRDIAPFRVTLRTDRSAELIETGKVYGAPLIDIERKGS